MPQIHIRQAAPEDVPLILALIRELALYEHEPDAVHATEAGLLEYGFGPQPRFGCFLAESDGTPAALALFFHNFSTWTGHPGIHLEDLFVREPFRGQGIGKALLATMAQFCLDRGYPRLQWEVLGWNQNAIDFYQAHGARRMSDWSTMRVEGDALTALAAHSQRGRS